MMKEKTTTSTADMQAKKRELQRGLGEIEKRVVEMMNASSPEVVAHMNRKLDEHNDRLGAVRDLKEVIKDMKYLGPIFDGNPSIIVGGWERKLREVLRVMVKEQKLLEDYRGALYAEGKELM